MQRRVNSALAADRSIGYRPARSNGASQSKLKRPHALMLGSLLASILLLAGCGGPASTVFNSSAPTESILPYITGSNYAGEASVVGLRGKDGTEVWKTPVGARDDQSATAEYDGVLYLGAAPSSATPSTTPPSAAYILALRLSDGKLLWRTPLPQPDFEIDVTTDGTTILAAVASGGLYALDPTTGAIRWHVATPVFGAAHIAGNVVVVTLNTSGTAGDATAMAAYRESDGTLLWQSSYTNIAATNQHAVYTTAGDDTFALSPADGHQIWYYQSGSTVEGGGADNYHGQVIGASDSLALTQETFPVVSNTLPTKDYLAALSASTGQLVWKSSPGIEGSDLASPLFAAPSAGQPVIYGGYNSKVVALRESDGARLWQTDLAPYSLQQLAYADGVLFVFLLPPNCDFGPCSGPTNTRLVALNATTGATYWERDLPDAGAIGDAG